MKRSLRLLQIEMIITATLLAIPIMVPFYQSIGMDQGQIGLSQSIFTFALLLINIPTGWIADRFSRRLCNIAGDFGTAIALLYYSQAQNFGDVIVAEIVFGISLAFSQGADSALLRAYSKLLSNTEKFFRKQNNSLAVWQPIAQAITLTLGGFIGADNPRLAIALSAIPFVVGCVLSLFMKEAGERLVSQHKNPLRDMVRVTLETFGKNSHLRWTIAGFAVGREITHVMVWAFTPILILAGVPLTIVGVGWVINALMAAAGAQIAKKFTEKLRDWQRFAFPMVAVMVGLTAMSIHLSAGTIWLYALLGLTQGWTAASLLPMVQSHAPEKNQATVVSIAKSAAQLLYIPTVWLVGLAGNFDIRLTMVATIAIFGPLIIVVARRLFILERS